MTERAHAHAPSGASANGFSADLKALVDTAGDIDQPWYIAGTHPNRPPPNQHFPPDPTPATLTAPQTIAAGTALLTLMCRPDQHDLRARYYSLSRYWHRNLGSLGTPEEDGGDFGPQWLALLAGAIPATALPAGAALNVNDFGNIHRFMFLTLRRAVLAITSHDIHPNPDELPGGAVLRSFHWVPNDTSRPNGTYGNSELGVPLDQA